VEKSFVTVFTAQRAMKQNADMDHISGNIDIFQNTKNKNTKNNSLINFIEMHLT